jgi:hypothetical protein
LLVTVGVVPNSPILVTLMKEALSSSETSVLSSATRRNIPEDTIFIITAEKTSNLIKGNLLSLYAKTSAQGVNRNSLSQDLVREEIERIVHKLVIPGTSSTRFLATFYHSYS